MEGKQLVETIQAIYDIELHNYMIKKALDELNDEITKTAVKKSFKAVPPPKPPDFSITSTAVSVAFFGALIGGVAGLIYDITTVDGTFNKILGILLVTGLFALIGFVAGFITGIIAGVIRLIIYKNNAEKEYKKNCADRENLISLDKKRVEKEEIKKRSLTMAYIQLSNQLNESKKTVLKMYSRAGIDNTYQNIIPMGYMNELARLGISAKLYGTDGLYNLVRNEIKNDRLQYTMEEISNKLDILIDREHMIYNEILQMNNYSKKLSSDIIKIGDQLQYQSVQLSAINNNTAAAAYCAERQLQENRYMRALLLI